MISSVLAVKHGIESKSTVIFHTLRTTALFLVTDSLHILGSNYVAPQSAPLINSLIGMPLLEIVNSSDLATVLRRCLQNNEIQQQFIFENPATEDKYLEANCFPICLFGQQLVLLTLSPPCSLSSSLLNTVPIPGFVTDERGQIIGCNSQMAQLFGYRRSELLGNPMDCLALRLSSPPTNHVGTKRDGSKVDVETLSQKVSIGEKFVVVYLLRPDPASMPRTADRMFKQAQKLTQTGSWHWDINNDVVFGTDQAYRIYGVSPRTFMPNRQGFMACVHPDDRRRVEEAVEQTIRDGKPYNIEHRVIHPDGKILAVHARGQVFLDSEGQPETVIGMVQDISVRKAHEVTMAKLSFAINHAADPIAITDRLGIIEYVNDAFVEITGYSREESLGQNMSILKSGYLTDEFYEDLWKTLLEGKPFRDSFINRRKNGELFHEDKTITPLHDNNGQITNFIVTGRDITERVRYEERIYQIANYDALTKLPNRNLLIECINLALSRDSRRSSPGALLNLELDGFSQATEALSGEITDHLIRTVGARLRAIVRNTDTVARLGDESFAVLLEDVPSTAVISVVKKILNAVRLPFKLNDQEFYFSASIGINLYPDNDQNAGSLLRGAESAKRLAKREGGDCHRFFTADMNARTHRKLSLANRLYRAIEREEFELHYQPQVEIHKGRPVGFEALLRWRNDEGEIASPSEFIPILEETGLIIPVGNWVMQTACAQLCAWRASGMPAMRMAVNLSLRQLRHPSLVDEVSRLIYPQDLGTQAFELEITESAVMHDESQAIEILRNLHDAGVALALDDFGTGYSSMAYLKHFPIDTLKLAKSFIDGLPDRKEDTAIVRAIIALGRSLKMTVLAEGVVKDSQLAALRNLGCDLVQGYYFSRPLPAKAVPEYLKSCTAFTVV